MKLDEAYLKFYRKDFGHLTFPYKLDNSACIREAVLKTGSMESKLSDENVCVFNPFSLTNVMRKLEHGIAYVSESEKKTLSTKELISTMRSFYAKLMSHNKMVQDSLDSSFEAECFLPDKAHKTYGIVKMSFIIDLSKHDASYYVDAFTRRAHLMNYNMVDYDMVEPQQMDWNGETYECTLLTMQFEAACHGSIDLGADRYVYHITTANAARKIMSSGLLPRNTNLKGFRYPDRVYVFIDTEDVEKLAKGYAILSGKMNKAHLDDEHLKKLPADEVESMVEEYKDIQQGFSNGLVVDDRKFVLMQIDLEKAGDLKLYQDTSSVYDGKYIAAYTCQPIPANAITCCREVQVPKLKDLHKYFIEDEKRDDF